MKKKNYIIVDSNNNWLAIFYDVTFGEAKKELDDILTQLRFDFNLGDEILFYECSQHPLTVAPIE